MIFTLHRYIFRELFRIFILATVALTGIVSFGSILRSVHEYGIGPQQVLHLIGYSLPIMLTFVLPIAALFASSLVYGRFASDNELDACRASGISFMTLIYPGMTLAVIVAIANLILSFHVMPNFVKRAEKSFKNDASSILFRNIQRKGFYHLEKDYILLADKADPKNELLSGIIVVGMKDGRINDMITAERAKVQFVSSKHDNQVHIITENTMRWNSPDKQGAFTKHFVIVRSFPSLMADSIKFKTIDDMKLIYDDPIQFAPIRTKALETYDYFTTELLLNDINKINSGNKKEFYRLSSNKGFIEFRADSYRIKNPKEIELVGNVELAEYNLSGEILRTSKAPIANLHIEGDQTTPTLSVVLNNATWKDADGAEGFGQRPIAGLFIPQDLNRFLSRDILKVLTPELIKKAMGKKVSPELSSLQKKLQLQIEGTKNDIQAEKHSRLVFGIGCLPLIMIGIGLGVIRKGGHLLSAFGVSAIPAAVLIVFIMSGKQLTKNQFVHAANSGIILMWTGVILLFILSIAVYRKLLKN